ncbi:hypothetical protein JCM10213_005754 [Rhodosporidiobolus nylandii]
MPNSASRTRAAVAHELEQSRAHVAQLEAELAAFPSPSPPPPLQTAPAPVEPLEQDGAPVQSDSKQEGNVPRRDWPLSLREYKRYGRQMMLSGVGLPGQLKLKRAHVLVVGAGGLGCPVLLYLAAAGVGEITILDHDTVELSNLHRQVLHTEARVGMSKAESAKIGLEALNSDITVHAHSLAFVPSLFHPPTASSAPPALLNGEYSLILDCTDNPATRHFLNAYAVAHHIPLVSGGAVRAEGTVGAYGVPLPPSPSAASPGEAKDEQEYGPCYACVFPPSPPAPPRPTWSTPPADDAERAAREREEDAYFERLSLAGTGACSDEGVLGILCGVVGIGMAAEAVKVLLGTALPSLHLFSPLSSSPYRSIKTRARKPTCPACGVLPSSPSPPFPAAVAELPSTPQSRWTAFLASPSGEWPGWSDPLCALPGVSALAETGGRKDERIKAAELPELVELAKDGKFRMVDTRPPQEFGIASVEGSVNIPFSTLLRNPALALSTSSSTSSDPRLATSADESQPGRVLFLCRRGNDSLLAARALKRHLAAQAGDGAKEVKIEDVVGGLVAWAGVEEGFPVY